MTDAAFTPSQLNAVARDLLESSFPAITVEGEICNLARPASGHVYLALKDARAQVRCALFRPKSQWLRFQPRDGMRVVARGRLTLYEARGEYQMILDTLEEAGEGALRRAYEEMKARLEAEGLFDAARKRPMPRWVRRLGVLTSPTGAAVRDVLSVLARRFPLIEVEVLPVPVQGEAAAAAIRAMLARADASGRYDALLLARGGGSLEDLWSFNDEALARAIAACTTPVVSAVGHETDFTLADFAADLRAPTPSVAAELLVPERGELALRLRGLAGALEGRQRRRLRDAMQRADRAALRLAALRPEARLEALARRQADARRRLDTAWRHAAAARQARLRHAAAGLRAVRPEARLAALRNRLERLAPVPGRCVERRLGEHARRLQALARALEAVSPLATVARGYAILQRPDGTVLREAAAAAPGDRIEARLADGTLALRVEPHSIP
jgi:exodeoxyribonuclease VII large subunit